MRSQESMEYSMPRITVSRCMYETGIATSSDACIYPWWQSANRATVKMPRFGGYKVRVWSACLVVQAIIKMQ